MASCLRFCLLSALFVIFGTSCSSAIVKKPEIHQVKKVAIISVTAPQRVPHQSGKGQVAGWDSENRTAIADRVLTAYEAEFKKLGWVVLPVSDLSRLSVYQENFSPKISKADNGLAKALNSLSTMSAETTYFSPTGLFPVVWEENSSKGGTMNFDLANMSLEKNKDLKTKMQEVATQAGVDAAVLVQADYCYDDGSVGIGYLSTGTGSAVITGTSAIYAVTPKGLEVIKMKRIPKACGGNRRVASDSSTVVIKGNLLFKKETIQKMFDEVARKSAAENVKQIQDAMKD